ncbi:hypothetical protein TNCT_382471 [Trichonephila clavata]|uniref:Uncharacterized protein n=1 Tax=Trichonephila clavata TaxID=2740835 RepID=A0A8X6LHE8_TRICU|nr:hypothetical protein TNCT_382471 [Trichonephila clavata]
MIWPEAVAERIYEELEPSMSVEEKIVSLGKSMGLEVEERDVNELVEEHTQELTTEEIQELQSQQHTEVMQEIGFEESEEEVISTRKSSLTKHAQIRVISIQNFWPALKLRRAQRSVDDLCDVKKEKETNSYRIGKIPSHVYPNLHKGDKVICPEMCFFCFDVLDSHLNRRDPPKTPSFSNDC